MHHNARRVQEALEQAGATGRVRELGVPVPTAAAAAEAIGCEVGAIANSLVFLADDEPLLVLTSGAHRVDTSYLAERLGVGRIRRADVDTVRSATGQPVGGVAPLGHPAPLRTVVDAALAGFDEVWAAGGVPTAVFPTTHDELVRVCDAPSLHVRPAA